MRSPLLAASRQDRPAYLTRTLTLILSAGIVFALAAFGVALGSSQPAAPFEFVTTVTVPRSGHQATLLRDGSVLVSGGQVSASGVEADAIAELEMFDHRNVRFLEVAQLSVARTDHTATLLSSGQVLIAGGQDTRLDRISGTAELFEQDSYEPSSGITIATGNLLTPRANHAAVRLGDGRVFVVGGKGPLSDSALNSTEIYDPETGVFQAGPVLAVGRYGHTVSLLGDGRVVIAGGFDGRRSVASVEVYDPLNGELSQASEMTTIRRDHTATVLGDGRVLLVGGIGGPRSAEVYDPRTGLASTVGGVQVGRDHHASTLLSDGRVLVTGGFDGLGAAAEAELFDPEMGVFTSGGGMVVGRFDHTATLLTDGTVLVVGGVRLEGFLREAVGEVEMFDPVAIPRPTAEPSTQPPVASNGDTPVATATASSLTGDTPPGEGTSGGNLPLTLIIVLLAAGAAGSAGIILGWRRVRGG